MTSKNKMKIETRAQEILRQPYSWVLIPQEGGGFSAEILEFPGCYAEGETADEAHRNLADAAQAWVELCLEKNEGIPAPVTNYEVSGKFALRLTRSLYSRVTKAAMQDGTSLNQFIVECIAERLGAMRVLRRIEGAVAGMQVLAKIVRIVEAQSVAGNSNPLPPGFPTSVAFDQQSSNTLKN